MILKLMLIAAILVQLAASVFAVRLVRVTRYNSIWILFIVGFFLLSVERIFQLLWLEGGDFPMEVIVWVGVVVSVALSIGVMYTHKLFRHIGRMNRHRQRVNRRVLTAVLRTEEKSRAEFAKELHDGLGPLLSSAKMSLSAIPREGIPPERRKILENTAYVIDESIRSLREIANSMSPHVLSDFGLVRAVQHFIDRCAATHRVAIRFETRLHDERFDTDMEVILYRVVCELINNSLKHADCTEIALTLSRRDDELTLNYADNGRGFDPGAVRGGMGLSNIASRIQSLNGRFDLASEPGGGTRAVVKVGTPENPADGYDLRIPGDDAVK